LLFFGFFLLCYILSVSQQDGVQAKGDGENLVDTEKMAV
jgi:hypothetical protein